VVLTIFYYHYLAVTSIILAYSLYLGNLGVKAPTTWERRRRSPSRPNCGSDAFKFPPTWILLCRHRTQPKST